jgi:hypothetical protein
MISFKIFVEFKGLTNYTSKFGLITMFFTLLIYLSYESKDIIY